MPHAQLDHLAKLIEFARPTVKCQRVEGIRPKRSNLFAVVAVARLQEKLSQNWQIFQSLDQFWEAYRDGGDELDQRTFNFGCRIVGFRRFGRFVGVSIQGPRKIDCCEDSRIQAIPSNGIYEKCLIYAGHKLDVFQEQRLFCS